MARTPRRKLTMKIIFDEGDFGSKKEPWAISEPKTTNGVSDSVNEFVFHFFSIPIYVV